MQGDTGRYRGDTVRVVRTQLEARVEEGVVLLLEQLRLRRYAEK